ncbi:MAG: HAMP domain-containing histidine kinase, partial [Rhodospirillales bacterium]|nr:HAMP domain-containing histidine kinase [Rhodospirillales bacterium]
SLTARLGRRLAAVMVAAILLAALAVAWRTIATIHALDDSALQNQAHVLARHLARDPSKRPDAALPPSLTAVFQASDGDNIYLIYGGAGALEATSDPRATTEVAPFVPAEPGLFRTPPSEAHPHGMVGLVSDIGPWRIVVAQGHEQQEVLLNSVVQDLLTSALWLLGPLGLLTVAIGVLTLRHGLRPLREVSAAAARIGPGNPGQRLPATRLPRELQPVVAATNAALLRLEQALDAQRRFVADAAHSLRTPLAVLTARLDALPDAGEAGIEAAALRHDADRLSRLVAQLLSIARLDGTPLDVQHRVDLHEVAVEAVSALAPLAIARGIELALIETAPASPIAGNAPAIGLALANLIENALAHAPTGSTVEVELIAPAAIEVRDRGPGIPEAELQAIFDRFQRGRRARGPGAGLGLAIVAEIAAAHGGSVQARAREGGGACFVLSLAGKHRRLAPGEHGPHQVLPVQHARDHHAGDVQPDQDEEEMGGDVVQVGHPGHPEIGVGLRQPAAAPGQQQEKQ